MSSELLFTPEQHKRIGETVLEVMHSKYLDPSNPPTLKEHIDSYLNRRGDILKLYKPDAFQFDNPDVMYRETWQQYFEHLMLHDTPTNKKGTRRRDTSKKRGKVVKGLSKYLGRTPTTADLKEVFPTLTHLDDEMCRIIDNDLERMGRLKAFLACLICLHGACLIKVVATE